MIWQDLLLMFGVFGFGIALIPTLRSKDKPPISTSVITGSILVSLCIAYITLGLWLAFIATLINSSLWFIIAYQRWNQNRIKF